MRVIDVRHKQLHHVHTPDLLGRTESTAGRKHYDEDSQTQSASRPASAQEAVQAYLSYSSPQWLSVDIKPGVFTFDDHAEVQGAQRSVKKPVRKAGVAAGVEQRGMEMWEKAIRDMPQLLMGAGSDASSVPIMHFRTCLREALLTNEQIHALEANPQLTACTYFLQQLSQHVREIVCAIPPQKAQLARVLHKGAHSYVLLFEKMVTEFVRLTREQTHEFGAVVESKDEEIKRLQLQEAELRQQLEVMELECRQAEGLTAVYRAQKAELNELRQRVSELREFESMLGKTYLDHRIVVKEAEERRQLLEKQLRHKEEMLRRHCEAENAKLEYRLETIAGDVALEVIQGEVARKRREEEAERQRRLQMMFKERSTQTSVDQDGVWDAQDGWPLHVSTSAWARIMWRKGTRFARCPACLGQKPYLKLAEAEERARKLMTLPRELVAYKKRGGKAGDDGWWIPDQLVKFLTHVPRSIEAKPVDGLPWLYKELWCMLREKAQADEEDYYNGEEFMNLADFFSQECLRKGASRLEAEVMMFNIIRSMKAHRQQNSLVHVMARFMGLLEEPADKHQALLDSRTPIRGSTYRAANTSLDVSFLVLYLYMRRMILARRHEFDVPQGHRKLVKPQACGIDDAPSFAAMNHDYVFWVPLDVIFDVICAILYFLPRRQLELVTTFFEEQVYVLKPSGDWVPPQGNRVVIRRAMRRAKKKVWQARGLTAADDVDDDTSSSRSSPTSTAEATTASGDGTPLVNMDLVLEYIMDILLDRSNEVSQKVYTVFVTADQDGDGLISYDEFVDIVRQVDANATAHKINKMFREAYKNSDTFAMSPDAFLSVCKQFGMIQLLDLAKGQKLIPHDSSPFNASGSKTKRHGSTAGKPRIASLKISEAQVKRSPSVKSPKNVRPSLTSLRGVLETNDAVAAGVASPTAGTDSPASLSRVGRNTTLRRSSIGNTTLRRTASRAAIAVNTSIQPDEEPAALSHALTVSRSIVKLGIGTPELFPARRHSISNDNDPDTPPPFQATTTQEEAAQGKELTVDVADEGEIDPPRTLSMLYMTAPLPYEMRAEDVSTPDVGEAGPCLSQDPEPRGQRMSFGMTQLPVIPVTRRSSATRTGTSREGVSTDSPGRMRTSMEMSSPEEGQRYAQGTVGRLFTALKEGEDKAAVHDAGDTGEVGVEAGVQSGEATYDASNPAAYR